MTYRNGKCYDSYGREMSQSQINAMYKASQEYIHTLTPKQTYQEELSKNDILEKLKNSNFVIK